MPKYRYHDVKFETLASGRPLYQGVIVDLEDARERKEGEGPSLLAVDHPHNAKLIEQGALRLQPDAPEAADAPDAEASESATTKRKGARS